MTVNSDITIIFMLFGCLQYKTSYKKSIGRIEKSRKNIWQKVRLKRAAQRPLAKAKGGSES